MAKPPVIRQRMHIRFTKQDDLRWLSHLDLVRLWERLFRRAGVALSMTEGFHPKPRMNFPSALAVGIAGLNELLEVDLAEEQSPQSLRAAIAPQLPPGMAVTEIDVSTKPLSKAHVNHVTFEMSVPDERQAELRKRIDWLLGQVSCSIEREGRTAPLDLRPFVTELALAAGVLRMRLGVLPQGSARPREILAALQVADLEFQGFFLTRTRVEVE